MARWMTAALVAALCVSCGDDGPGSSGTNTQDIGDVTQETGSPEPDVSQDLDVAADDTAPDAGQTDTAQEVSGADIEEASPDAPPPDQGTPDGGEQPFEPPAYPHFDGVVDLNRGGLNAWAHLIDVYGEEEPVFHELGYGDTSDRNDYWPASSIKVYPVTAALMILAEEGLSLDAEATFYHDAGEGFVRDITMSVRDMIFESFTCSSNETYTLLLRLAGVDYINSELFGAHGFTRTALMRGYNSSRPWAMHLDEPQRVVLREADREVVREHSWSGRPWADEAGCTVYNGNGNGNCSSPGDMAEHMRRVMFHEILPAQEQFDVRAEDLDWVRFGGEEPVMNNKEVCGGPGWDGVREVFPEGDFFHKGGRVSEYRLDLMYVDDDSSGKRYVLTVVTDSGADEPVAVLSEAVARMVRTPDRYVWLDYLVDYVNPVVANLTVYSQTPGRLALYIKDYQEDAYDTNGWSLLPGTEVDVPAGWSEHEIASDCLDWSRQVHIRGRLWGQMDPEQDFADSDLHYVVVDGDVQCP